MPPGADPASCGLCTDQPGRRPRRADAAHGRLHRRGCSAATPLVARCRPPGGCRAARRACRPPPPAARRSAAVARRRRAAADLAARAYSPPSRVDPATPASCGRSPITCPSWRASSLAVLLLVPARGCWRSRVLVARARAARCRRWPSRSSCWPPCRCGSSTRSTSTRSCCWRWRSSRARRTCAGALGLRRHAPCCVAAFGGLRAQLRGLSRYWIFSRSTTKTSVSFGAIGRWRPRRRRPARAGSRACAGRPCACRRCPCPSRGSPGRCRAGRPNGCAAVPGGVELLAVREGHAHVLHGHRVAVLRGAALALDDVLLDQRVAAASRPASGSPA